MSDENMSNSEHGALPTVSEHKPSTELAPEDPFANPGLPAHVPRRTDIDPRAAKRAERQVAFLFALSAVATITFLCCYTFIPHDAIVDVFPLGKVSGSNLALGLCLGVALFCIGAGAIHWARTLMTDEELVQERHPMRSDDATRAQAVADFKQGAEESGFGRRSLIRRSMMAALGVLPLAGVWMLRDLGPLPKKALNHTAWKSGDRIISDDTSLALRPEDIPVGALVTAKPQGLTESAPDYDDQLAKASIMLVRMEPTDILVKKERDWGYQGIVAFSKICTHVGCPLGLYEQHSHHMLCPCHQSTFDLANDGKVIWGPAARSLPQLAITVDSDGYLVARGDFSEPVGPSYWERG